MTQVIMKIKIYFKLRDKNIAHQNIWYATIEIFTDTYITFRKAKKGRKKQLKKKEQLKMNELVSNLRSS